MSYKRPKYGDKVAVPWGLGEVEGTVVYVYGPPGRQSVVVRIPVNGPRGEVLEQSNLSVPKSALRLIESAA
jgi:hypothetical protein